MQLPAARIAIHQHRAIPRLGERERKVRRHERLPIAGAGARDGEHYRPATRVRVGDAHADRAERLDDLRGLLGIGVAAAHALDGGYGAEDGETQLAGGLLRVAEARVGVIEEERQSHRAAQTCQEREDDDLRPGAGGGVERSHSGIEDRDVRNRTGRGEPRLFGATREHGVETLLRLDVAHQPHLIDGASGDRLERRRRLLDLAGELSLLLAQLADERAEDAGDSLLAHHVHTRLETLHRGMLIGVELARGAELHLTLGEVLERGLEVRCVLGARDQHERVGADPVRIRQERLQRLAVALHRLELELLVEVVGRHRVARGARHPVGRHRELFGRERDRAGAEALELRLSRAERVARGLELVLQRLRRLREIAALEVHGGVHELGHHSVQDRRRALRAPSIETELQEGAPRLRRDLDSIGEAGGNRTGVGHREGDRPTLAQRRGRGLPEEAQRPPDGVAHRALLEDLVLACDDRILATGRIDAQLEVPAAEAGAGLEAGKYARVGDVGRPEVEPHVLDHAVHDRGALQQIRPRAGTEEFFAAYRAARVGIRVGYPERPLHLVLRYRHAAHGESDAGAHECDGEDQPFVTTQSGNVATPRNSRLLRRGLSERGGPCLREPDGIHISRRVDGEIGRDVVRGHSGPGLKVETNVLARVAPERSRVADDTPRGAIGCKSRPTVRTPELPGENMSSTPPATSAPPDAAASVPYKHTPFEGRPRLTSPIPGLAYALM